jgi:hypothetical protein
MYSNSRYMSFSANKLRVSMGLPSGLFPIRPGSHVRTTSESAGPQRVTSELYSLGYGSFKVSVQAFLHQCLTPSPTLRSGMHPKLRSAIQDR